MAVLGVTLSNVSGGMARARGHRSPPDHQEDSSRMPYF